MVEQNVFGPDSWPFRGSMDPIKCLVSLPHCTHRWLGAWVRTAQGLKSTDPGDPCKPQLTSCASLGKSLGFPHPYSQAGPTHSWAWNSAWLAQVVHYLVLRSQQRAWSGKLWNWSLRDPLLSGRELRDFAYLCISSSPPPPTLAIQLGILSLSNLILHALVYLEKGIMGGWEGPGAE